MRKNIKNLVGKISGLLAVMPDKCSSTLRNRLKSTQLRFSRPRIRSIPSTMLILILCMSVFMSMAPTVAQADGGDFSITHRAADPVDYPHILPGTVIAPIGNGTTPDALNLAEYGDAPGDSVTSLAPKNIALGQIVVYEYLIEAKSTLPATDPGIINFTYYWDAETENNGDFGYDENYGVIGAFVDTSDDGNLNLDGDENISAFSWSGIQNDADPLIDTIHGTFTVTGLDANDKVVVEVWVVLDKTIPSGVKNNVASGMINASTSEGDKINVGTNKIPLLQIGSFFTEKADISVIKYDEPDPVNLSEYLNYTLVVTNNALDVVANGVNATDVLDTNTTFVSANGAPYTINGNMLNFTIGALSPGQNVTLTINTTVKSTAPTNNDTSTNPEEGSATPPIIPYDLLNFVSVKAITSDDNPDNNTYYQPTNVLGNPAIDIDN